MKGKIILCVFFVLCIILVLFSGCRVAETDSGDSSSVASTIVTGSDSNATSFSGVIFEGNEFTFINFPDDDKLKNYSPRVVDISGSEPHGIFVVADFKGLFRLTMYFDYTDYWGNAMEKFNKDKEPFYLPNLNEYSYTETNIMSPGFKTSKGIQVGSTKSEVLDAYKDYDIVEYEASKINDHHNLYNIRSLIDHDDNVVKNPILHFNNSSCFADNYPGNPFERASAMIFLFDDAGKVNMMITYYPTAG